MLILKTASEIQSQLAAIRSSGKKISFVPTMGALHPAHLSLVEIAKKHSDYVVMSLFVNPTQFNVSSDFENYPKTFDVDAALAKKAGVDVLFMPETEEIYPAGIDAYKNGETVKVVAGKCSRGLCGATRPGHFDGVVTVVSILFHIVSPDVAVFGAKDYQQAKVISEMIADQRFPIELIVGPTVRDEDGLAMSSRNLRLNKEGRLQALGIPRALKNAQEQVLQGERSVAKVTQSVRDQIAQSALIKIDYVEIVHPETLEPVNEINPSAQLLVAVFVNGVRLIDNVRLSIAIK